MNHRQPRSIAGAVIVVALALATVVSSPAGGQEPESAGFAEGRWVGSFSYIGTQELGGLPVRYRAVGTFELVSGGGETTGLWDLYLLSLIEGAVANGIAGGPVDGDGIVQATLELDTVTATDALTGLEITMTADDLPDSGAGWLTATSTQCGALSGRWEVPLGGALLDGAFVANRTVGGAVGTAWQRFQQDGLNLLTRIDDGEVPLDAIRLYLTEAEQVMGDTTERDETCDRETFGRFNTAALALGDAMVGALASRLDELSDDELLEVTRMGWRSGAFLSPELALPFHTALDLRMTASLAKGDLGEMEYWLPVARELGRDVIAQNLQTAIEEARR